MSDPRPGFDEVGRPRAVRMPRSEVVFGLLVGLVLAAILVAVIPDARTHMFGGTTLRETTVTAATVAPRDGNSGRDVTTYQLSWVGDHGDARTTTFKRSGPPRRAVGETWDLWVSEDGQTVETDSPLTTWLFMGVGLPLSSVLMGWLWAWRQRVLSRSIVRDVERRADRAGRRHGSAG